MTITTSTPNIPEIPPPSASTRIVMGTAMPPVTSPMVAAVRKRWAASSTALGTLWRIPRKVPTAASDHASVGSEPASAGIPSTAAPAKAPATTTRRDHETSPSASPGDRRPSASATERISASATPEVKRVAADSETNAM